LDLSWSSLGLVLNIQDKTKTSLEQDQKETIRKGGEIRKKGEGSQLQPSEFLFGFCQNCTNKTSSKRVLELRQLFLMLNIQCSMFNIQVKKSATSSLLLHLSIEH